LIFDASQLCCGVIHSTIYDILFLTFFYLQKFEFNLYKFKKIGENYDN